MNPYEQIGLAKEYIWELERVLLLIILETKHNNGRSEFSDKVWRLAEEGLSKKPKGADLAFQPRRTIQS